MKNLPPIKCDRCEAELELLRRNTGGLYITPCLNCLQAKEIVTYAKAFKKGFETGQKLRG